RQNGIRFGSDSNRSAFTEHLTMAAQQSVVTPLHFCLSCHYPLDGLASSRCPECGTPFDLKDPHTFLLAGRYPRWIGPTVVFLVLYPLTLLLNIHLQCFTAAWRAGIWRNPPGPGLSLLPDDVFALLTFAAPIAGIAAAALIAFDFRLTARKRRRMRWILIRN